jgi:hypothetical protein
MLVERVCSRTFVATLNTRLVCAVVNDQYYQLNATIHLYNLNLTALFVLERS